MTNPALLEQLYQELTNSPNFGYLPIEEQASLKARYADATDEQLQQAIQIIQTDTAATTLEIQNLEQKQIEAAEKIKQELRRIKKEELKVMEKQEIAESEQKSADLLNQLNNLK
jgi:predicted ABC-type ATPase